MPFVVCVLPGDQQIAKQFTAPRIHRSAPMEQGLGLLPAARHGGYGAAEHRGGVFLGDTIVIQQIENLSPLCGRPLSPLAKLGPFREIARWRGEILEQISALVADLVIRVVVAADPVGPKVLASEIDEFSTDPHRGKVEEMVGRLDWIRFRRLVEPDHRILEHVVGLLSTL